MKHKAPILCSEDQICKLPFDNVEVDDFSIMVDGWQVYLSEHHSGEQRKQHITLPREVFDKLIRWYTEGIVPKEDKRKPERHK